jgi:hypothetical protein
VKGSFGGFVVSNRKTKIEVFRIFAGHGASPGGAWGERAHPCLSLSGWAAPRAAFLFLLKGVFVFRNHGIASTARATKIRTARAAIEKCRSVRGEMPQSRHRRKKGQGRASTRAERRLLSHQSQKKRYEAWIKESREERRRILLENYGPEPENGYDEWQLCAADMMEDGMEPEEAEALAKQEAEADKQNG